MLLFLHVAKYIDPQCSFIHSFYWYLWQLYMFLQTNGRYINLIALLYTNVSIDVLRDQQHTSFEICYNNSHV